MTVLSDASIRVLMGRGELIPNGDPGSAKHCSYEFKAGRVVYGGIVAPAQQVMAIDLCSTPTQTAVIQPSGVAWVRSQEQVKIPANIVGIWVQTNSLSRRGLLLLNSTLVEPGYEGYLSAHFVNLGSSAVSLSSGTTIAKLLFVTLDADAAELVDSRPFGNYDAMIDGLAAASNRSFLRINELVPDLSKASEASVADAKKRIDDFAAGSLEEAKSELSALKRETFLKVGGGFVLGLALAFSFSLYLFPKFQDVDVDSTNRISRIVIERNAQMSQDLKRLQADVDEIRRNSRKEESVNASGTAAK